MHLKSKLRAIIKDQLKTTQVSSYRDRLANKQMIKNFIVDKVESPAQINWPTGGSLIRILATNKSNAENISTTIERIKNELPIRQVHVIDKPVDYFAKSKISSPLYESSVLVELDTKEMFKSTLSNSSQDYWSKIKEEVLEDNFSKKERVVIDFSSPNIAKPFHFGHLKSTILGNFLSNLNTFLGNQVTKLNYIGDWGTQYGLLSLGLDEVDEFDFNKSQSPLKYLLDVYIKANERGQNDQNYYSEAKKRFLELDKEENSELFQRWRKIRDLSLEELKKSYAQLGITFDVFEYESGYARESVGLVDSIKSKSFVRSLQDGVIVADVQRNGKFFEVPLLKSDGSSLYLSRDIVAAMHRKKQYEFDKMLYIVGADQEKHFHCLKEIIKNMDCAWSDGLVHVKMGKVIGMSSRSGSFLLLSDIIDEATKKYVESTKDTPTSKVTSEKDILDVGRNLALSALFVYDMRNKRTRNYEFDWDLVMLNSSRSGINLQTTFARLTSLLNKTSLVDLKPLDSVEELDIDALCCSEATTLASHLDELDLALHSSYWSMDPSYLTNHALQLCKAINRARRSERLWVLGEPDIGKARSRLSLFKSAHVQLEFIIKLLGLRPLYKV